MSIAMSILYYIITNDTTFRYIDVQMELFPATAAVMVPPPCSGILFNRYSVKGLHLNLYINVY